jgi:hypothetical protein
VAVFSVSECSGNRGLSRRVVIFSFEESNADAVFQRPGSTTSQDNDTNDARHSRREDGRYPVWPSCATISNPHLLSSSEICVNPRTRS